MMEQPQAIASASEVKPRPRIVVIDDDEPVRVALSSLFRSVGMDVMLFDSPDSFVASPDASTTDCLVLDVRLPGLSGLDFQHRLSDSRLGVPVIFITGYGDIPMSVRAMKAGAVDFLVKPFRDQDMLDAVASALAQRQSHRSKEQTAAQLRSRFAALTSREAEIMKLVVSGLMNKQIAASVGLSEITVKVHRGRAMKKMQASSLVELVRMAGILGLSSD